MGELDKRCGHGGYVGKDYFRFGEYITTTWTMNGLYATDPEMQPVISTPGHPLHLHGYQTYDVAGLPTVPQMGGHVGSAEAISVTATVWPLSQVITHGGEADLTAFYAPAFRQRANRSLMAFSYP